MIDLNTRFYKFEDSEFTSQVNELLDKATVSISWCGTRLISVEGYKGTHDLNFLTRRYFNTLKNIQKYVKSSEEVPEYFKIWGKLKVLYIESDKLIAGDFFARFCNFFEAISLKKKLDRDPQIAAVQEYINFLKIPKELSADWKPARDSLLG